MEKIFLIVHQIFWVLVSFCVFYFLMLNFVFKRVDKIFEKREGYIAKLAEQVDSIKLKTLVLEKNSNKIVNEEIPEKQRFFIDRTLEPVIADFRTQILDEMEMLEKKLDHQREKNAHIHGKFKEKTDLALTSSVLIEKINKVIGAEK